MEVVVYGVVRRRFSGRSVHYYVTIPKKVVEALGLEGRRVRLRVEVVE